jgi:hypothetical protein
MQLRIATREEAAALLAALVCLASGPLARCTCGRMGDDWPRHRGTVLTTWFGHAPGTC